MITYVNLAVKTSDVDIDSMEEMEAYREAIEGLLHEVICGAVKGETGPTVKVEITEYAGTPEDPK